MSHLDLPLFRLLHFHHLLSAIYRIAASILCNALTTILTAQKRDRARGVAAAGAAKIQP
jgi:hypothetical protein